MRASAAPLHRGLYCLGARRRICLSPCRRSQMFKKSEEQEWTRFRGALSSKDRDEAATMPVTPEPNDTIVGAAPAATGAAQGASGPSFRSSAADVNVGLPSTRMARSPVVDNV